jgi:hypothetical protein
LTWDEEAERDNLANVADSELRTEWWRLEQEIDREIERAKEGMERGSLATEPYKTLRVTLAAAQRIGWTCSKCDFENFSDEGICFGCQRERKPGVPLNPRRKVVAEMEWDPFAGEDKIMNNLCEAVSSVAALVMSESGLREDGPRHNESGIRSNLPAKFALGRVNYANQGLLMEGLQRLETPGAATFRSNARVCARAHGTGTVN